MGILAMSRTILSVLLRQAVDSGTIKQFFIDYKSIMDELEITDRKKFIVCIEYLTGKRYIQIVRREDDDSARLITLLPEAIDFLEG